MHVLRGGLTARRYIPPGGISEQPHLATTMLWSVAVAYHYSSASVPLPNPRSYVFLRCDLGKYYYASSSQGTWIVKYERQWYRTAGHMGMWVESGPNNQPLRPS